MSTLEGGGESRESRESRKSGQRIARIKKEIKRQTLVIHDDFLVIHGGVIHRSDSPICAIHRGDSRDPLVIFLL